MTKYTRKAIIETFIELLEEKSLDKISIKDIILRTEINRNTFYYHYRDIYSLLNDIFSEEVNSFRNQLDEEATFYEEYTRAAKLILEKRIAIIHIYQSKSSELIKRYLNTVVFEFVTKFVKKKAEKYKLNDDQIKYIVCFYSYSIIENTMHWIEDGLPVYREDIIKMISRTFEVTIDDVVTDVYRAGKEKLFYKIEFR